MLPGVDRVNQAQKNLLAQRVIARFGDDPSNRRIYDVREAPSRVLIDVLLGRGAQLQVYDPVAMQAAQRAFGVHRYLQYAQRALDALAGADALLIVTEWIEFRSLDFASMRAAKREPVMDGRNLYEPALMRNYGFEYRGIGR